MFDPAKYPANWREIADVAKARMGWQCQACGIGFAPRARRNHPHPVTLKDVNLGVHHRDGDRFNCALDGLLANLLYGFGTFNLE